ncbi:Uncharacterised protein [Mycobacteroides abscessus subsp. massiliense]|nr:Uncharacterised protein [Mycobacteroides abscessus subsp. massiliense]
MVRRMVGTRAEPHVPGFGRVSVPLVAQHPKCLIGKVFRKMIALLRAGRLLDEAIVLDEVGIPVVGLTAEKAVVPVEALL